jgi:hypothetical protein
MASDPLDPNLLPILTIFSPDALEHPIALDDGATNIPLITDHQAFQALLLSQSAIDYVHRKLPHGSINQLEHLERMRSGEAAKGDAIPRFFQMKKSLHDLVKCQENIFSDIKLNDYLSFYAELSQYYGVGNCGDHAAAAYAFLCSQGAPGFTIAYVDKKNKDHSYVLITWEDENGEICKNPVVCDAWPRTTQACRWSEFSGKDDEYESYIKHTIDKNNEKVDIRYEAFKNVQASNLAKIPLPSATPCLITTEDRQGYRTTTETNIILKAATEALEVPSVDLLQRYKKRSNMDLFRNQNSLSSSSSVDYQCGTENLSD